MTTSNPSTADEMSAVIAPTATRDDTKLVACGGCDAELPVIRREFETGLRKRCTCGAWADLAFHRRHATWNETDTATDDDWS